MATKIQKTFLCGRLSKDSSIYRAFSEANPLSEKFVLSVILQMVHEDIPFKIWYTDEQIVKTQPFTTVLLLREWKSPTLN